MIAKRFEVVMNEFDEVEYIMDKVMMEDRDFAEFIDFVEDICKENERLKEQIEYQEEGVIDAIDSLMELPSATIYLLKQWIDALEEFDSIEDIKNTFSKRIKELEE